ncbi:hypothetical protein [Jiangella alkaliphila]|uniref:Uncharacterized protein n=1 Tax=Jiangella alkaliphila TaxID=419479 RepID=A0A1H2GE94_9ACTN|nr:hypothetical protein [Jiangella alkaliphila]SDU17718.1 hypothetical protein SAMN04488563_0440 [Jiangella alkaliphila]
MSHATQSQTAVNAGSATPALRTDFDLDLTVLPVGDNPDVHRIFASDTQEPCQCSTDQCH